MTPSVLESRNVLAEGVARTRDEAIREAGALLVAAGAVTPAYVDSMFEREDSVSTYMGNFLAIPHGTNEAKESIVRSSFSFVRYPALLDWDGRPVRFVLGIAGLDTEHLEILASIAILFSDDDAVQKLIDAGTAEDIVELLEAVRGAEAAG